MCSSLRWFRSWCPIPEIQIQCSAGELVFCTCNKYPLWFDLNQNLFCVLFVGDDVPPYLGVPRCYQTEITQDSNRETPHLYMAMSLTNTSCISNDHGAHLIKPNSSSNWCSIVQMQDHHARVLEFGCWWSLTNSKPTMADFILNLQCQFASLTSQVQEVNDSASLKLPTKLFFVITPQIHWCITTQGIDVRERALSAVEIREIYAAF